MTEQFKRQFDYNVKVMKAATLAKILGWEEGYYGNLMQDNPQYELRLRNLIHKLVGDKWPEVVQRAYDESYHEGYMES